MITDEEFTALKRAMTEAGRKWSEGACSKTLDQILMGAVDRWFNDRTGLRCDNCGGKNARTLDHRLCNNCLDR